MALSWQKLTVAEFAAFERMLEQRVFPAGGTYWKRVRPLFYRPMLPYQEIEPGTAGYPFPSLIGGVQHAVPSEARANSFLNCLLFEDAQSYSLESLDYNRKRQMQAAAEQPETRPGAANFPPRLVARVKQAAKQFEIRPVSDVNEFKAAAYPVYLSFFERTQYQYGSRRRDRDYFNRWADNLFQFGRAVVLGGYRKGVLGGVNVSLLVEDTVCYSMVFCDTDSLRHGLSDLILHSVRQAVAESRCARQIFSGLYKGGNGLDDFYLLRGCRLVKKPARLRLNPLAALVLRNFLPDYHARLMGEEVAAENNNAGNRSKMERGGPPAGGNGRPDDEETAKAVEGSGKAKDAARLQAALLAPRC